ncbi:hypothetical protein [Leptospira santarosai]|uniref:hypothetical protein n=1 Tax=Leptospira santarosai TaxID=28183 RepID=UPI001E648DC7|nr:hypothetical protein [Leptospira santarosai]
MKILGMNLQNLDSKNIYAACHIILPKVTWVKVNNYNKYVYIGVEDDFKEEVIKKIVSNLFDSEFLYLSLGRENSKRILLDSVVTEIKFFLPEISKNLYNAVVVSLDFTKILEFNSIGVVRYGVYSSVSG